MVEDYAWWRLSIVFPREVEESLIWRLQQLSINNYAIQSFISSKSDPKLFIWLPEFEWEEKERSFLTRSLCELSEPFDSNFGSPVWDRIQNEDWSQTWKIHWEPDPVGESLLILPAWLKVPTIYSDRIVLRIDPGSAFGTGSHATTRLCLEALERENINGMRIADLGCGSGILGLAALKFGAKSLFAVDIDSLAVNATLKNACLNDLQENLIVSKGSIEALETNLMGEPADLMLCNILASVIEDLAPKFARILKDDGVALLSGLLVEQVSDLKMTCHHLGWQVVSQKNQGRWALLEISKRNF